MENALYLLIDCDLLFLLWLFLPLINDKTVISHHNSAVLAHKENLCRHSVLILSGRHNIIRLPLPCFAKIIKDYTGLDHRSLRIQVGYCQQPAITRQLQRRRISGCPHCCFLLYEDISCSVIRDDFRRVFIS